MKSYTWIILLVVVAFFAFITYNGLVTANERLENAWGQVETEYQSRADKVKSIAKIVKGAANFEQKTLSKVIEARASATKVSLNPKDLTPENLQKFEAAQQKLSSAFSKLLVSVERYPELKATAAFRDFQHQYEGIENRINKARRDFNDEVKSYNIKIKKMPGNIFASLFGFDEKPYFKSAAGAENAPDIDF